MAQKGNPISVRLDLNRSSDSSRFNENSKLLLLGITSQFILPAILSFIFLYFFSIPVICFCEGDGSEEGNFGGSAEASTGAQERGADRAVGPSSSNPPENLTPGYLRRREMELYYQIKAIGERLEEIKNIEDYINEYEALKKKFYTAVAEQEEVMRKQLSLSPEALSQGVKEFCQEEEVRQQEASQHLRLLQRCKIGNREQYELDRRRNRP